MAELASGWTPYRYGFNNPVKFIDPDGMFEYVTGGYGEQIEIGQVWSHTEDGGYRSDIEGSSGTGKSNAEIVVDRANNIYNVLKDEGARRAGIKAECCQDDKKKRDSKHPPEIVRSKNGGYGYMGVSKNVGSVTWYQMSDKRGNPFWVDKDWNSREKPSMFSYFPGGRNFSSTEMYDDLNKIRNSKIGQISEVLINRGVEVTFFFYKIPYFINDPVVPYEFLDSKSSQKVY